MAKGRAEHGTQCRTLKSAVNEALKECVHTLEAPQSVTNEDDFFSVAMLRQEFEERAEAVLVVVLRYVSRNHRLKNPCDDRRILWCEPEKLCDELVTFVSDVHVGSNGFQELPFAESDRSDMGREQAQR
jgi:hypothetical protein